MIEWWKGWKESPSKHEDMLKAMQELFDACTHDPEPPVEIMTYTEYFRRTVGVEGAAEVIELERLLKKDAE